MSNEAISWNVRGASKPIIRRRILALRRKLDPDVIAVLESKLDAARSASWFDGLSVFFNAFVCPSDGSSGRSGGMVVLWKKSLPFFSPVCVSNQCVHCVVVVNDSSLLLSVVYAARSAQARRTLWEELGVVSNLGFNWIGMGDYNAISSQDEKSGGLPWDANNGNIEFGNFIINNNLYKFKSDLNKKSWCNHHKNNETRIYEELDKVLANGAAWGRFGHNEIHKQASTGSDHRPITLDLIDVAQQSTLCHRKNKCFRLHT